MQKVKFSVAENNQGILTKRVNLLRDGTPDIVPSHVLYDGAIREHSCTPDEFGPFLRALKSNQAIISGLTGLPQVEVVTAGKLDTARKLSPNPEHVISRTQEHIRYNSGPGLLMLDHDKAWKHSVANNPLALEPVTPETLAAYISWKCGQTDACSVVTGSVSSHIHTTDGRELRGAGHGFHMYYFVECASDIPRFIQALFKRLFLDGWGHIRASKAGHALARGLIDTAVGMPERLIYEAAPVCGPGIKSCRPDPVFTAGALLRTENLPDLTPEEEREYRSMVSALIEKGQHMLSEIREKHVDTEARKLSGVPYADARQIVERRVEGILSDEDILYFQRSDVTVGEVLDNPAKWDQQSLADPREPDYNNGSRTTAKFYWNDGKPRVNSLAHGGGLFKFARFPSVDVNTGIDPAEAFGLLPVGAPEEALTAPPEPVKIWAFDEALVALKDAESLPAAEVESLIDDILLGSDFPPHKMSLLTDKLHTIHGWKKADVEKQRKYLKRQAAEGLNDEVNWGHAQIAEDFLSTLREGGGEVVGYQGDLWTYNLDLGIFERLTLDKLSVAIGLRYTISKFNKKESDHAAVTRKIYKAVFDATYFDDAPLGVPCHTKFHQVQGDGSITERDYSIELRQRSKFHFDLLPGGLPEKSLFGQWLTNSFQHDDPRYQQEQIDSFQMAMGSMVAALGGETQQAVFCIGEGQNGKSVLIELLKTIFPKSEVSHTSPVDFGDKQQLATLAGKRLNLTGDVAKNKLIPTGIFKQVVGGDEPINVKVVYLPVFAFQPYAVNVFSANDYLRTDDWSRGFKRRFIIFRFLNEVKIENKIAHLGRKIANEEAGYVLDWCLKGAAKLAQNNYHIPETRAHYEAMNEWQCEMNSIDAFFADTDTIRADGDERVQIRPVLYEAYVNWCKQNHRKHFASGNFLKRLQRDFKVETRDVGTGYHLQGYKLINNIVWPI